MARPGRARQGGRSRAAVPAHTKSPPDTGLKTTWSMFGPLFWKEDSATVLAWPPASGARAQLTPRAETARVGEAEHARRGAVEVLGRGAVRRRGQRAGRERRRFGRQNGGARRVRHGRTLPLPPRPAFWWPGRAVIASALRRNSWRPRAGWTRRSAMPRPGTQGAGGRIRRRKRGAGEARGRRPPPRADGRRDARPGRGALSAELDPGQARVIAPCREDLPPLHGASCGLARPRGSCPSIQNARAPVLRRK